MNTDNVQVLDEFLYDARSFSGTLNFSSTANLRSMSAMFKNAASYNGAEVAAWNVAQVSNFDDVFNGASVFNQNLQNWNVSAAVTLSSTFQNALQFNQPIGAWRMPQLRDLNSTFRGASLFNQELNNWDTSKVTVMTGTFAGATAFQKTLSTWNTRNVQSFAYMFASATSFAQSLANWVVVAGVDFAHMFDGATVFSGAGLDQWNLNTNSQISLQGMFSGCTQLSDAVVAAIGARWSTQTVTDMSSMFQNCPSITGVGLETWNTGAVQDMSRMFQNAVLFNPQNLSTWDVRAVTDMSYMFSGAASFRGVGLEHWQLKSTSFFDNMFSTAALFNAPIGSWFVGTALSMNNMFFSAGNFAQDLTGWCVPLIRTQPPGFATGSGLTVELLPKWASCGLAPAAPAPPVAPPTAAPPNIAPTPVQPLGALHLNFYVTLSNATLCLPLAQMATGGFSVDWADGVIDVFDETTPLAVCGGVNGTSAHTYAFSGGWHVTIQELARGSITHFGWLELDNVIPVSGVGWASVNPNALPTEVLEWNDLTGLRSLAGAFLQATLLMRTPNYLPPAVRSLSATFAQASAFNDSAISHLGYVASDRVWPPFQRRLAVQPTGRRGLERQCRYFHGIHVCHRGLICARPQHVVPRRGSRRSDGLFQQRTAARRVATPALADLSLTVRPTEARVHVFSYRQQQPDTNGLCMSTVRCDAVHLRYRGLGRRNPLQCCTPHCNPASAAVPPTAPRMCTPRHRKMPTPSCGWWRTHTPK